MISNKQPNFNSVIPAKAGIQQINQPAKRTTPWFCPASREFFNLLDGRSSKLRPLVFRFRGNDGSSEFFGIKRCLSGIAGLAALAALGGCVDRAPYYESKFGEAETMVRAQQIINPDASRNPNPVNGLDGMAGVAAIGRYHKSFENPPAPVNVFTIGVGGGSSSSGMK